MNLHREHKFTWTQVTPCTQKLSHQKPLADCDSKTFSKALNLTDSKLKTFINCIIFQKRKLSNIPGIMLRIYMFLFENLCEIYE